MTGSTRRAVTITAIAAAIVGSGVTMAIAANPSANGTITACVKGTSEYFPNTTCRSDYRAIKWNAKGPRGPAGPPGSNATINGVPAGGDLTGTYPNPDIASNAVSGSNILNGSLSISDLASEDIVDTIDLGSINPGACDDFTMAVSTSDSNPVAVLNPPGNFFTTPGLVFNWNIGINHLDPVEVHVCNVSAAAIDPPSGGWRAVLFAG